MVGGSDAIEDGGETGIKQADSTMVETKERGCIEI